MKQIYLRLTFSLCLMMGLLSIPTATQAEVFECYANCINQPEPQQGVDCSINLDDLDPIAVCGSGWIGLGREIEIGGIVSRRCVGHDGDEIQPATCMADIVVECFESGFNSGVAESLGRTSRRYLTRVSEGEHSISCMPDDGDFEERND